MTERAGDGSVVGRVALRVADRERLTSFYESVLGLTVRRETADQTELGTADRTLVVLLADPDAPPRGADETGLFHLALRVPDRTALAEALARIEDGWELTGASGHVVSEALYLSDPEGTGIEVYHDRPRAEWPETADGNVEMDTLPLDLDELRALPDGTPPESVPPATELGHVHLEASDLAASRAFYVEGLGLRERARYGDAASFLAIDDYHHHVGVNTWNRRTGPGPGRGLAWWELRLSDEQSVEAVADRLSGRDVAVERSSRPGVDAGEDRNERGDALVVTDPDGIELRIRSRQSRTVRDDE
jgi:catechol 2,3-dioxygenase